MARILNVISAVTPMGGTITKLRALMQASRHEHYLYHPGYDENRREIEEEIPYYDTINVPAFYGIHNRNVWKHVQEVSRLVQEHGIDIVHFYFHFENTFAPFLRLMHPEVKMVRSIVGSLIHYEKLGKDAEFFKEVLEKKDRSLAGPTAPPQGLFLWHVNFCGSRRH